jgi:hypothetical protein
LFHFVRPRRLLVSNRRLKISLACRNNTQNRRKEPLEFFDLDQTQYRFLDVALCGHKRP